MSPRRPSDQLPDDLRTRLFALAVEGYRNSADLLNRLVTDLETWGDARFEAGQEYASEHRAVFRN